jgi:hypothetical protein
MTFVIVGGMVMTLVIMASVVVAFMLMASSSLSRFGLEVAFDSVSRTQR